MPITAGPQEISLFHRTGPANRTANPLSVVLAQWTLIAADQAGSVSPWSNRRIAPSPDVTVTGRLSTSGRASRYVPGDSTSVPCLSTSAWRSSPGLASIRLGSGASRQPGQVAALSRKTYQKALTARRDQSYRHRLPALVAIRSEEQIGRLAIGTRLENKRKGRRIVRNRCPAVGPVNPGPPHRVGQHTSHDRDRGRQSGDRHMHVTRRPRVSTILAEPGRLEAPSFSSGKGDTGTFNPASQRPASKVVVSSLSFSYASISRRRCPSKSLVG